MALPAVEKVFSTGSDDPGMVSTSMARVERVGYLLACSIHTMTGSKVLGATLIADNYS